MSRLLHQLLAEAARRSPDAIAVSDDHRQMSYSELARAAGKIANLLLAEGVGRGDRVGLYSPKSVEAIAGIYGVLLTGAAYVPLDPDAPVDRIAYIVGDCGIETVITSTPKLESCREVADAKGVERLVVLDGDPESSGASRVLGRSEIETQDEANRDVRLIDLDLALILYTSGSTGRPKGVMLSHLNVMTFVRWAVEEFGVDPDDRLSQIAPLHFDLSTFDVFGAAMAGASVHLAPRQATLFPMEMRRFLEERDITVMYAVPTALTMLAERAKLQVGDLSSLRVVLFAGEVFPTKYLSRTMSLLPEAEFANLFGPTETNVCTFYRVPDAPRETDPPISIGKAIDNVDTIVVKEDGSVASPGEVGELYVRGSTVMLGYWGDPERTEQSRIVNIFGEGLSDPVYKTGDLVSEGDDGNYTYLGRKDNQIKSRGYRIELEDIEAAMYGHPEVAECAAVAIPDEKVTNRLKAFVVARGVEGRDIASFLADRIPKYMIPEEFEFREVLPKTSTGKIDRQSLLNQG